MSEMNIHKCPETGMCTILKADGKKVDLTPAEVSAVQLSFGDHDAIVKVLSNIDPSFADAVSADDVTSVYDGLK